MTASSTARKIRRADVPKMDFAGALQPPEGQAYPVQIGMRQGPEGVEVVAWASGFNNVAAAKAWMDAFRAVLIHATGAVEPETKH